MPRAARPLPPPQLPAYGLYGERRVAAGPAEPLHVETIAERSRRHDWEIRPHRHESLLQVLVVRAGRAEATLDGAQVGLDGPAVVTVPPLAAHGFVFATDVDGAVFTVAEAHVARLLAGRDDLFEQVRRLRGWPLPPGRPEADAVLHAADALRAEFQRDLPWRALGLDTALLALLLALARCAPATAPAPAAGARALLHVQRLRALVEQHYRRQPTLAALAGELGITTTQLNRACQQVLGHPALAVLHERLLREAQRELAYTTLSIKRIALDLGFCDAGYFTRFVQRHTGRTPSAWRAAMKA